MALQTIAGNGLWLPRPYEMENPPPTFNASAIIDATGEKYGIIGQYWNKARASANIRKIHFRFGAVTKAGGSALTVSLQDVSLTAGPPGVPDETQDQTVAIANADAGFASNVWYTTGNLSADRTVACGELLSVVWEYDGAGRLGADSVVINAINTVGAVRHRPGHVIKTGGTWANFNALPFVIFEHDDGTFGTFEGTYPCSAINTHAFKQDTAVADEYALAFQVPFPCKTDGAWLMYLTAAGADFDLILYDGTSAMANGSVTVDANTPVASGAARIGHFTWGAEISLTANHTYYLAVKPTQTAATVTVYSFDVAAANHLTCHDGGTAFNYSTRLDLGAWAAVTTTRRLLAGIRISALDDGLSGIPILVGNGLVR